MDFALILVGSAGRLMSQGCLAGAQGLGDVGTHGSMALISGTEEHGAADAHGPFKKSLSFFRDVKKQDHIFSALLIM